MTYSWTGFIKVRLLHREGASVLLPEVLVIEDGDLHWVQPQFFNACVIVFGDDPTGTIGLSAADRHGRDLAITARFQRSDRIGGDQDRSEVYRCSLESDYPIEDLTTGRALVRTDGGIDLLAHHHTTAASLDAILASGEVWGSPWNYQGVRKLTNVAYAYFTSLPKMESEEDLRLVAMASNGKAGVQLDDPKAPPVVFDVYRESTTNREATLPLWIPAEIVSAPHVWLHRGGSVYYEIAHPWIHRVGLLPGATLPFKGDRAVPVEADLRRFDYAVLGDCSTPEGAGAPFDEEETTETFAIADLGSADLFDYWWQHQNQVLYTPPSDTIGFET